MLSVQTTLYHIQRETAKRMMKIIKVENWTVTVEDENRNRSSIFQQGNQIWKCLRCHRVRCDHAKFVIAQNITPPGMPELTDREIEVLIDE